MLQPDAIKMRVREHYGSRVSAADCCGGTECCASADAEESATVCCRPAELPEGFARPSLGCGSPLAYAHVQPGETIVDLGSGAGGDVLLAARESGPGGEAIGIDMTPEMIWKARENARRVGVSNAEFRLGEIEHLPLPDTVADVVISNCVINLVPDKLQAFREAYRVLRPGGRLVVSDVVANGPLPEAIRKNADAWAACVAGASEVQDYLATIAAAGFQQVEIITSGSVPLDKIYSATVSARKPAAATQR